MADGIQPDDPEPLLKTSNRWSAIWL